MKKEFSGNLSGLKPHERFQLSVKALARGDKTFHKQLVRSCPPEDVVEYYDLLEASRECTIQVLPALHRILGRWELINDLVLCNRDSKHVNYFYATYREHPELSEDTCKVVEGFYSFLAERQAGIKGNNDSRRSELTANALVLFLPHLYSVHYYGVEGVYVSDETEFVPGLLDSAFCMIACYHLDKARGLIAESLGLVWPAFSSVCRSGMCLEPDIVMEAFSSPVAISLIEEFSYELEELDVESNINQEWVSSLRKTWQCYNG